MNKHLLFSSLLLLIGLSHAARATTYYVSPTGNDANLGTAPATAWRSIDHVNSVVFRPGDKILFEATQTFAGTLKPQGSGTATLPIIFSSYGPTSAIINSGVEPGFIAYNTDGIELRRLTFVGAGRTVNAENGVLFYRDAGNASSPQFSHITLDSLDVSGYQQYGITIGSHNTSVDFWGEAYGYDDVRITNTLVHDNGDTGIFSYGATLHANRNWYVANCKSYNNSGRTDITDRNTGSGIVLANIDKGLVTHCETYNNGRLSSHIYTGPAGMWAYSCNNLVVEYSESHHNHSGTLDGGGFDLDGGCTNSVLQYNYSHDNDGPGFMLAQFDGAPVTLQDVAIRYNVSENDARRYGGAILLWSSGASGGINRANVHNNTIYVTPTASGYVPQAVYLASPHMHSTAVRNNIFQTTGGVPFLLDYGRSSVLFQGNCYWNTGANASWKQGGATHYSLNAWRNATGAERVGTTNSGLEVDPLLNAPGSGGTNPMTLGKSMSAWMPYQLQANSPLIGAGLDLQTLFDMSLGAHDLYNLPTPTAGTAGNIGANERRAVSPLPVELVKFTAENKENLVSLGWTTAMEVGSAFFEVQRSTDGRTFTSVANVAAAGTSTSTRLYTWNDPQLIEQVTYYRLRQVDVDGTSHHSSVAVVSPRLTGRQELSVFPNPIAKGEALSVNMAAFTGRAVRVSITSLTGQVAFAKQFAGQPTSAVLLQLPASVAPGTYLLSVSDGQKREYTRLVIE
ncbi:right-handed parallel beta-helix repeat-containing protein [Hymenobacter mucosus]|uniref:Por secretion system C-terminal sorting domain-containing protein n=1 Tax=Hymenobacter mucosus TaxID=1411120 RepID=A0A238VIC4_9BACT|nr:right-handed parallel beta-helix repeat-containing protein [Hymenobacter mucosus]SNR34142.1 Por secretion system C-terminal sorting domain-containing protein [Hymenobacter mucosus]